MHYVERVLWSLHSIVQNTLKKKKTLLIDNLTANQNFCKKLCQQCLLQRLVCISLFLGVFGVDTLFPNTDGENSTCTMIFA